MIDYYDPNDAQAPDALHLIRFTLMAWDYVAVLTVETFGVDGLDAINTALSGAYHGLLSNDQDGVPQIVLFNSGGEALYIRDDEDECDEWLARFVTRAEIIAVRRTGGSREGAGDHA